MCNLLYIITGYEFTSFSSVIVICRCFNVYLTEADGMHEAGYGYSILRPSTTSLLDIYTYLFIFI